jgi:hypothetical protein
MNSASLDFQEGKEEEKGRYIDTMYSFRVEFPWFRYNY